MFSNDNSKTSSPFSESGSPQDLTSDQRQWVRDLAKHPALGLWLQACRIHKASAEAKLRRNSSLEVLLKAQGALDMYDNLMGFFNDLGGSTE